jgi:ammonium transporter Rh
VSTAIPTYLLINRAGIFDEPSWVAIDNLINAEFAAASLLIASGALLGRLKIFQYIVLAFLFIPCYMLNEWMVTKGGLGFVPFGLFVDTGGSIYVHLFGALFGTMAAFSMTTLTEFETKIESNATSERFSLLGSMVLWVFWPSFCAALVPPQFISHAVVATVMALCGATLATYIASFFLHKHKVRVSDIAHASLAGGVAISASCQTVGFRAAFFIGITAGVISTFGFAVLQPWFQRKFKKVDTCGVLYLHGIPGLFGGMVASWVVPDIPREFQTFGTITTVVFAFLTGFLAGKILHLLGHVAKPYQDDEDMEKPTDS